MICEEDGKQQLRKKSRRRCLKNGFENLKSSEYCAHFPGRLLSESHTKDARKERLVQPIPAPAPGASGERRPGGQCATLKMYSTFSVVFLFRSPTPLSVDEYRCRGAPQAPSLRAPRQAFPFSESKKRRSCGNNPSGLVRCAEKKRACGGRKHSSGLWLCLRSSRRMVILRGTTRHARGNAWSSPLVVPSYFSR